MNFMPIKDVSLFRCYIIHRHIDGRFTGISQQVPLSGNEYENVDTKTQRHPFDLQMSYSSLAEMTGFKTYPIYNVMITSLLCHNGVATPLDVITVLLLRVS